MIIRQKPNQTKLQAGKICPLFPLYSYNCKIDFKGKVIEIWEEFLIKVNNPIDCRQPNSKEPHSAIKLSEIFILIWRDEGGSELFVV